VHVGLPKAGSTTLQQHIAPLVGGLGLVPPHVPAGDADAGVWRPNLQGLVFDPPEVLHLLTEQFSPTDRATVAHALASVARTDGRPQLLTYELLCNPWAAWWMVAGSNRGASGPILESAFRAETMAARLRDVLDGGVRILLVVREQARWVSSLYRFTLRSGGTTRSVRRTALDFERLARMGLPGGPNFLATFELYEAVFGAGSVEVLPLELLAADPARFGRRLADLLGEPGLVDVLRRAPNENVTRSEQRSDTWLRFEAWLRFRTIDGAEFIGRRPRFIVPPPVGSKLYGAVHRAGRMLPAGGDEADLVANGSFDRVRAAVAGSNRVLSERTGLDLAALGYAVA